MKLNEVLSKTIQFFKNKNIEPARLDAELLIAYALKIERIQLYVKFDQPLSESEINLSRELVKRRTNGEPVAYIIEEQGFYALTFKVKTGVLIPRPETEQIVDEVLKHVKKIPNEKIRILDLGAGTGCIGLALIKNIPHAELVAVEKSNLAFEVLKQNAENLKLLDRCELINQPVESLNWPELGQFNYIVSNPPYIAENDPQVDINVRKFEPAEALFADHEGYSLLKNWSTLAAKALAENGLMLFEHGSLQGPEMKKHFEGLVTFADKKNHIETLKDLSGLDRIIKARA